MNGIIIVDKPKDWTSHDVIAKLRGVLRQKRIGHGGTLDPMATGVLPVFIGRATRAAEFCENADKEYIAGLTLGIVTDTQDITGNVLDNKNISVTAEDLIAVLPQFTGAIKQIPPMFSAIKKDGKKLYELARKGMEIPRAARDIFISKLECDTGTVLLSQCRENRPSVTLRIVCSKGTYIRTLCHDIGAALGCGGTLSSLRRTGAGVYTIETSHTMDDVIAAQLSDSVSEILLPTDSIFSNYPLIKISTEEAKKAKNGALCVTQAPVENGKYRVYAHDGEFLLLGEVTDNKIKTIKSFFEVYQ
ncbi:MAG: tRNA pseudouridine(55) synthase TruB [Oscillospiraceae bacterium]|nr:tRNA pseudouridine(55) synthase TruB [Oscillospiraceae bacterium]